MRFVSLWQLGHRMKFFMAKAGRAPHLEHNISGEVNYRNLPPMHSFSREAGVRPLQAASEFASAAIAGPHEFRMMDANGELEWPLVDSHYQVWKLPTCKIQRVWKRVDRVPIMQPL